MDIVRYHETTVFDLDADRGAFLVVLPESFLPFEVGDEAAARDVAGILGGEWLLDVPEGYLTWVMAALLDEDRRELLVRTQRLDLDAFPFGPLRPESLGFAEYLLWSRDLPFEQSPLSGESLGALIAGASGASMGAVLGVAVAGAATPLLLVTVPGGIILVGVATGIAEGLREGLRERIRNLLRGGGRRKAGRKKK